jgi:hypothetical protein
LLVWPCTLSAWQTLEQQGRNIGSTIISKAQLENSLDRFNIMMPDAAFDQFWATLDASADSTSIAQFLSITAPSKDG